VAIALAMALLLAVSGQGLAPSPRDLQTRGLKAFDDARLKARTRGQNDRALFTQAADDLVASAAGLEAAGEPGAAAFSEIRAGSCYKVMGDFASARRHYERGLALAVAARHPEHQARAHLGLAMIATNPDRRYDDAARHIREGLALAATAADQTLQLELLESRGDLESAMHDYPASVRTYSEVIRALEARDDAERLYSAYMGRGSAYFDSGSDCSKGGSTDFAGCIRQLDSSAQDTARGLATAERLGWTFLASLARNIAALTTEQRRNAEIAAAIEEQRKKPFLDRSTPNVAHQQDGVNSNVDAVIKQVLVDLQPWLQKDGLPAEVQDTTFARIAAETKFLAGEMERLIKSGGRPAEPDRTPFLDPRTASEVLKVPVALAIDRDLNYALAGMNLWLRGRSDPVILAAFEQAQSAIARGDHNGALTQYVKLLDRLEEDRSGIADERGRSMFMENKVVFYERIARNLLHENRYAEAFDVLERNRARTLGELIASRQPEIRSAADRKLLAEAYRLDAEIQESQRRAFGSPSAEADERLRTLREARQRTLEQMKRASPQVFNLLQPASVGFGRAQALAREDDCDVVQYVVSDASVVIWHVGPRSTEATGVLLSRARLNQKIEALMKGVRREGAFDPVSARELYLFLIAPIRDHLRSPRLVILPDRELTAVPFQMLQDPESEKYLGESFQVSYAPSVAILANLKPAAKLGNARVASVVNTELLARSEVTAIGAMYPKQTVVTNPSPTELLEKLEGFDAVHFVAHGDFPEQGAMLARLKLAPAGSMMTAAEVFGLPLAGTTTVTRGACQLGRAEAVATNEMYGMVRGFLYAGAQSVVGALWDVDHDAAALYFETFYREARTTPLPRAAQLALLAVKARYAEPRHWAPFVYIGR
jgi:CHAT domain-containing protein